MQSYTEFTLTKDMLVVDLKGKVHTAKVKVEGWEREGFKVMEKLTFNCPATIATETIKFNIDQVKMEVINANQCP